MQFEVVWVLYNERIKRYVYANNTTTLEAAELRDALVLLASSEGMHDFMSAPLFKENGVRIVGAFVREKDTPIYLGDVTVDTDRRRPAEWWQAVFGESWECTSCGWVGAAPVEPSDEEGVVVCPSCEARYYRIGGTEG